ncbi:MAG: histidine--tRNA ligase [Deltaproteobacteria bacterium]|jgi:histidyl-tRNA synthetase|nr:histidine--tRNA ligase [Deltaproteobacteria bacterium]
MDRIATIKGFADLFSPESRAFTRMETAARRVFARYGYQELRVPVLEHTELFQRGIGAATDVVQKEMYTFTDRGGRSVTMRPEATAGIMRAYLDSGRNRQEAVTRLFTFGPMFRYERPQKGRLRQFHQIDCECLNAAEPHVDAEMTVMVMRFMSELGIDDLELQLNSLGCARCRPAYRELLRDWLGRLDRDRLCEDCRRRLDANPLRVLDCKMPGCQALTAGAPFVAAHICPDCREHFDTVRRLVAAEGVDFTLNHRLVRGLDYYTRTAFEVVSRGIGSQGAVAGGGRYDGLAAAIGGPDVPAIGFACGMERLAMLLPAEDDPRPDFHAAVLAAQADALDTAFAVCQALRDAGFHGELDHMPRSMKAAMRRADKSKARCVLIFGPDELAAGTVAVKRLDNGEQATTPLADAVSIVAGIVVTS